MLWYVSKTGKSVPLMWLALLFWPYETLHLKISTCHTHLARRHECIFTFIWKSTKLNSRRFLRLKINHLMTYKSNFAKYIKVKSQPYQLSVSLSEWMLNNNHLFITLICYVLSLCRVNLQWIVLSKVPKLSWENATVSPKREKLFFPFPSNLKVRKI